jgi:hypothetical protein
VTHQLLVYADDVNLLDDNIDTIKKNTQTLIYASKAFGLEVNTEETKHTNMLLSRNQNAGQNRDVKIANKSFEYVGQFKYLGTTVSEHNLINEEVKSRFISGNACYHSVQNLLCSHLLSKSRRQNAHKYNFACIFLSVLNLVSDIKRGM